MLPTNNTKLENCQKLLKKCAPEVISLTLRLSQHPSVSKYVKDSITLESDGTVIVHVQFSLLP